MIFSTQGRRPLIKPAFRDDLFAYLGGIIREMRGTALIINGTADPFMCWFVSGRRIPPRKSPV
jgi:hypothetical protein